MIKRFMENHSQQHSMTVEPNKKSYTKIIKESFSFAIALVVLIPFMIYFGVVLIYLQDMVLLEKLSALLGGLVALIVGYYFGQRPIQQLTEQVKKSGEETQQNKDLFSGSKVDLLDLLDDFDELKKENEELKTMMEKRKYE